MKSHNEITQWIDNNYKNPQKHPVCIFKYVGVAIVVLVAITASAGLLSYYAQFQISIDVQGIILVDDMEQPTIIDSFQGMAGTTTIVNHTFENLHDTIILNITLVTVSIDEGLNVTFGNTPLSDNNFSISPLSNETIQFKYHIHPYADPSENLTCVIEARYNDT